jgi:hypothetical protein
MRGHEWIQWIGGEFGGSGGGGEGRFFPRGGHDVARGVWAGGRLHAQTGREGVVGGGWSRGWWDDVG